MFVVVCSRVKNSYVRIKNVKAELKYSNLEDFNGNSSSSSSNGPIMSGGSLCCDARKLNISKVAFLIRKGGKKNRIDLRCKSQTRNRNKDTKQRHVNKPY